jgi:hypothetical protein
MGFSLEGNAGQLGRDDAAARHRISVVCMRPL